MWSCTLETCTIHPIPPPNNPYGSIQHSWPNWTGFKIYTYTYYYKVQLIYHSLILSYLHTPDYTCSNTTNRCYTKPGWILVSHHPDDVITISSRTPSDLDLADIFSQPPAKEILQLIYGMNNTHTKQTRSLTAIWWWYKLYKKTLKSHQSNPVPTPPTSIPNEYIQ